MRGVGIGKVSRLGWQFVLLHDRSGGANRNAGAAIDAVGRVHIELSGLVEISLILARMDGVRGAGFYAEFVFGASVGDYVGHVLPECNCAATPKLQKRRGENLQPR